MAKTLSFDMDNFQAGLTLLEDDSKTIPGSSREMLNIFITDRGGIAPRPGITMLGTPAESTSPGTGFFVFKKSFGFREIPMRTYGERLEAYCQAKDNWFLVKEGFEPNQEFGFISNLVNKDNDDFAYFSNRYQPFQRWTGQIAIITDELLGGETEIKVDSTIEDDIFYEDVVTGAPTTTTITVAGAPWVESQWVNFYVYITSGTQVGRVRKITANTTNSLTFAALPLATAVSDTFEIRMLRFKLELGGLFIYNEQFLTVTEVDKDDTLLVGSAHAAPAGTPITQMPEEFPDAPRGNRIDSLLGRTLVGNVRSALSRDAGGALQGSNSAGSVWVSNLNDPKDFAYDATRIAGQGDLISMPYGGGDITAIAVQEQVAYVYKRQYIEAIEYSQDINDIAIRVPLKSGVGSVNKVIKGKDDHFFMTVDKQFTSIGRVENKDQTVQTENIGLPIKRLLQTYDFGDFVGAEFRNRILFSAKTDDSVDHNNVTVVWNKRTRTFEGVWNIGAHDFDIFGEGLYFQEAAGPNVWKMFEQRKADFNGIDELPISSRWQSSFFNLLPIKGNIQGLNSLAFEGYISAGTTFTFSLYRDFNEEAEFAFDFGGLDDEQFLLGSNLASFLGANPLGLEPIGTVDAVGKDGRRRFSFMIYFPYIYGQYFSIAFDSNGIDQNWEILRATLGLRESISTIRTGIKQI